MKAYNITIPIYADSDSEAQELERQFYDFVAEKRTQGIAVKACKLSDALKRFRDNYFVINFLKQ